MYTLYIANRNYSSWSLRPWVLMKQLGIAFEEKLQQFEAFSNFEKFRQFSPSGTVPCLVDGDIVIWDSLAIVEYLAERHIGVWSEDPAARAFSRSATAEMHSGFGALRSLCPMNCAISVEMNGIPGSLQQDIDRIDEIWSGGLEQFGGPFIGGADFSAVDAFFCPVAYRVSSYQLPVSAPALAYSQRLLALPAMQEWDAAAIRETWREERHEEEAAALGRVIEDRRDSPG